MPTKQKTTLPLAKQLILLDEHGILPDALLRYGMRRLYLQRLQQEGIKDPERQQQKF